MKNASDEERDQRESNVKTVYRFFGIDRPWSRFVGPSLLALKVGFVLEGILTVREVVISHPSMSTGGMLWFESLIQYVELKIAGHAID